MVMAGVRDVWKLGGVFSRPAPEIGLVLILTLIQLIRPKMVSELNQDRATI